MSIRKHLLNAWLRYVEKPQLARAKGPEQVRKAFELKSRLFFHPPSGTQLNWETLRSSELEVPALRVAPRKLSSDVTLLYFHGGGFVFGSPKSYAPLLGKITKRTGMQAVLPQYRRAPEHPYPAAVKDARAAWDSLLASGLKPGRICVGGDSAGGALAFGLVAKLCSEAAEMPAAVFGFSPLTDLTFSGTSFQKNATTEAILPAARAQEMAQMYLREQKADDPGASPLFASYENAPPSWITVGDTEVLRDDARRLVNKLQSYGADVTFCEYQDLPHVWPLFHNILPEADDTIDQLASWLRRQTGSAGEN